MNMSHDSTVGILMPSVVEHEKFTVRYSGLERELGLLGVAAAFSFGHNNYDSYAHRLQDLKDASLQNLYAAPDIEIVRDLTMPQTYDQPIYLDNQAPALVHEPEFNKLLRRKDKVYEIVPEVHPLTVVTDSHNLQEAVAAIPGYQVILKPVTGAASSGVKLVRKNRLPAEVKGNYLAQEFIDNSGGDPALGIEGTHNLRLISINSELAGAVARVGGKSKTVLRADGHGRVFEPERLPDEVHAIADKVHEKFKELPGGGRNVIAIDLMYGKSKGQEARYVVCEINHRPVRIGPYDLTRQDTQDPDGMVWLGSEWDRQEAKMLADLAPEG